MKQAKVNEMMRGALLLTIAGIISKILSAIYRIPLQNLTGDLGFYIYQQVYPIIGIGMMLALYGYPAAVSKLVVERRNKGLPVNAYHVYVPIITILFGLNALLALLLAFGAPHLAEWIGDGKLISTYRAAAGMFLFMPFLAGLRGFYQGHEHMLPTAVSQIVEQLVRVGVIIGGAYLIFIESIDLYTIGIVGVVASTIGMVVAVVGWIVFFPRRSYRSSPGKADQIPWMHYIRVCLSLGIIAAMGHLILLLMQAVDVFTIVPGLQTGGVIETTAKEMKGIFDRGQPLIQVGAVLGSSFALALVPSVVKDGNPRAAATREALQVSFYMAGAASVGLIVLMPEINALLFTNTDGTASLRVLMVSVVLTAMLITAASILQNMGYVQVVAGFVMLACALKGLLNWLLVPTLHLMGSALGTVLSLFMLMILVLWWLQRKMTGMRVGRHIRFVPFLTASGVMAVVLIGIKYSVNTAALSRFALFIFVFAMIIIGIAIYGGFMLAFRAFSNEQLAALPFGHRLISLYEWLDQKKKG